MTAALAFRPRAAIARESWERFVEESPETWFWHLWDMMDLFADWPHFEELSFGVEDQGRLCAIVPLYLTQRRVARVLTHRYMESIGGPAMAKGMPPAQKRRVLAAIRERLMLLGEGHGAERIELNISVLAPYLRGPDAPRVNPLVEAGLANAETATWVVDLARSEEAIRAAYLDGTRYELRRAAREPYVLREAAGGRDIERFYELHCETNARTGREPNRFEYFQAIFERLVPKGLARAMFFERSGRSIAAQMTALYKGGAYYWSGPSATEKGGGENRVLCDEQIMAARARGCVLYETGEAALGDRDPKLRGISDYKRSFGARLLPHYAARILLPGLKFRVMRAGRSLSEPSAP